MTRSFDSPHKDDVGSSVTALSVLTPFEAHAERAPDSPALLFGPERLTYGQLNERANQLAHYLRQQSIGPESLVGVCLDRSIDMVVSLLAIVKAGGAYLPLDPNFPAERLGFMLSDARVSLLLTHSSKKEMFPKDSVLPVFLDTMGDTLHSLPSINLSPKGDPSNLAYVIYTSGSTGKPKGVMVSRSALCNFLVSMARIPGISSADVLLAVTTISFDISLLELLLPLVCGAQLVLTAREQAFEPAQISRVLEEHAVTIMQATPTTWRLLLDCGWKGKSDLRILCGGEALTPGLAAQLLPRCNQLWNMYGPTETTIWSSTERVLSADKVSLGDPIANTQFYVVNEKLEPVATGQSGELLIGGDGVARGYKNQPELTSERFIADVFRGIPGARLYRTGDRVRPRADGSFEFLGRLDHQVKLHGFRIELGEIESALSKTPGINQAVVVLREDHPGETQLVAYYTGLADLSASALRQSLNATLPDYMLPAVFVRLDNLPLTPNAKVDRKALPAPLGRRPSLSKDFVAPRTILEKQLSALWRELLHLDEVGIDDSFFDLGGNSLAVVRMVSLFHSRFGREIPVVKPFQYPTISRLAAFLETEAQDSSHIVKDAESRAQHLRGRDSSSDHSADAVAVIGMAGRFPGAEDLTQLWKNLCNSVESISFFTPEELGPGLEEHLRTDPDYIRARGLIEGAEFFDASFFGISPLEARVMDPQQRVFLELTYHALENAGYDPERFQGLIGIFAGIGDNHYYTTNLLTHPDLMAMAGKLSVEYGNQKDYIALRAAYLLDLRGPAVSLNTACSTTLLAVDQAYRSLLDHECDIALAGGIDITVPQKSGFLYQEGGTFAKDGHCRPFDADATGTMFCDGSGIVVLKRLKEAVADGDTIYAVLLATGKNNNGARPVSFLAPSVDGQAESIAMAQARANISVETIGYIEAHGTGTPVGDPIEIEALSNVFRAKTNKKQFCYVGSIKGNVGHPTNAAGVAGFIKAALVLHHEQIPPTLHYKKANPKIDFANSPFMVADKLIPFPRGREPRRTAASSFGFGGTNVHAILEEAPLPQPGTASRPLQLLLLSTKTAGALDASGRSLASFLQNSPLECFPDVAYTLQVGRKQMGQRRFVVAADPGEAARFLLQPSPLRCSSKRCERRDPPLVFLFGGQGTQYVNMGRNLYEGEPLFRAIVDDCCELLKPHLGRDLRELLYPQFGDEKTAQISLQDTFYTQPSIFVIEYALASLWQSLGVQPAMMAGHSIGEFVAATLAGVWDLPDALAIISTRGRLMQNLPRGSMLAVNCGAEKVEKWLPPSLQLASNNAPSLSVVSGPQADVAKFQEQLEAENITCRQLHTSHAFHSAMMDPMIEPLREAVAKVTLRPPSRPFVSTVTGKPITAKETTSPAYWANHARATVEFSKAIRYLHEQGYDLFLECGPRSTLCALTRQHFSPERPCVAIPSLPDTHENNAEWVAVLFALGSLWQNGVLIDWDAFYASEFRHRTPLPTYPFERQRYWVDPAPRTAPLPQQQAVLPSVSQILPEVSVAAPVSASQQQALPESRKTRITSRIIELFAPISGLDRSRISTSATFLEQGFDSLSLTQAAFAIKKEFGTKVVFSQLMNQLPTVELVAEHLDHVLASDQFGPPQPAASAVSVPVSSMTQAGASPAPAEALPVTAVHPLEAIVAEQARTISRLAELVEKLTLHQAAATKPPVQSSEGESAAPKPSQPQPMTPQGEITEPSTIPQRGIYFSSCLSPSLSASYNESMIVRFSGEISVPKLTRSIERLVERHDALRTSFDEGGTVLRIAPFLELKVATEDISSIPAGEAREEQLREYIEREMARPFDLPFGPLFRSQIVCLGRDTAAVIFTGHHLICDGWSLDVLIHDVCAFYSEELTQAPTSLPAAPSFAEYARTVTDRTNSPEFQAARSYWLDKFASGFPALVLPTDEPRTTRRAYAAKRSDRLITGAVVNKLRELSKKQNCSFFTVLLSALSVLLARVSRQTRFVLALPTADQPSIGEPGLVGHCVNLLPFVVELREGESVSAFLGRVQHELSVAQDHAAFTLVHLLQELHSISTPPGVSPVSAGLTNIKKFRRDELPQSGFSVEYDANPKRFESFEWYLNAIEAGDDLILHCHYDTVLFKEAVIQEWFAIFEILLTEMAGDASLEVVRLARLKRASSAVSPEPLKELPAQGNQASANSAKASSSGLAAPPTFSAVPALLSDENSLLAALLPLWSRVLDVPSVEPDDDFFALGGHSMVAAQLFALLEQKLGYAVPLATLYDSSTPRALAHVLAQDTHSAKWQSLVPINRSGSRYPLFLIHAAEGNVLLYRALASHLGSDQPVYGLQSVGLDGKSPIDGRFEHAARHYVEELRQVQPHGPYMLGGYCLGGTLAMEMARQLIESGDAVGLVAMIEAFNIRAIRWPLPLHLRAINHFFLNPYFHLRNVVAAEGAGKWNFFREKLLVEISRAKASMNFTWARLTRRLGQAHSQEYHHIRVADVYEKALEQYDVKPYPGEISVFQPARHLLGFADSRSGWGEVARGGLQVFTLPISPRGSLVEPYVAELARLLRDCMDRAVSKSKEESSKFLTELAGTPQI